MLFAAEENCKHNIYSLPTSLLIPGVHLISFHYSYSEKFLKKYLVELFFLEDKGNVVEVMQIPMCSVLPRPSDVLSHLSLLVHWPRSQISRIGNIWGGGGKF